MKIIKKITAIMLSIMMVLGMCSVVGAAEAGTEGTGTITINNAIVGQNYKIYKILTLESYDSKQDTDGKEIGLYSYKPAKGWDKFFKEPGKGSEYVNINENGYVTWKTGLNEAKAAELAQEALKYARDNVGKSVFDETNDIREAPATSETEKTVRLEFNNLPLGYYLVDSSVGALCGLTTTNPNATIIEKNGQPTVEKNIKLDNESTYTKLGKMNSANLGDTVIFQTTINVQPGAKNYILHDEMDTNLTFAGIHEVVPFVNNSEGTHLAIPTYYELVTQTEDTCTFELKFTEKFYQEYADKINDKMLTKIYVRYMATVSETAPIDTAMKNTTYLTYGDKNTLSEKAETKTYTYGIPVFKYTEKDGVQKGLAGAKFSLYTDANNTVGTILNFKENGNEYRYTEEAAGTTGTTRTLQSPEEGNFNINGLKAGTYWLKETEAPKGYNQLAEPIKIIIEQNADGTKTIKNANNDEIVKVKVENNAGSILPSTGGMGTTIFYIAGALLVLISGVVLIAKKRTDSK